MRYFFSFIIVLGIAILAYTLGNNKSDTAPKRIEQVVEISEPEITEPPAIKYPVPENVPVVLPENPPAEESITELVRDAILSSDDEEQITPDPLPLLDDSDDYMKSSIESLTDAIFFSGLINYTSLVRNFVITVDNLTAAKLPVKYKFLTSVEGKFLVNKDDPDDDMAEIAIDNYSRYEPFVLVAESVNLTAFSKFYFQSYPIFQQAYEELGYPDKYFNDRFVEVIDHLLETPEISDPVSLSQPKVFYTFTDPQLESLSSGQKILLRIGSVNSTRIKSRLRSLRARLIQ
jgi:hypothetical protein